MENKENKLKWCKLLTTVRRKDLNAGSGESLNAKGTRTELERDYDRILFSTPVRRLADKTQVFPLDKNDSIRTRLTHSHEVSNLARSIGVALVYETKMFDGVENAGRDVPAMLATVGLAHDIGNPPFGHQGEAAISSWFEKNSHEVFEDEGSVTEQMKQDYLNFEGNAQALRILTRLQILNDNFGLNLTCGTLAALMKYPTSSDKRNSSNKATKKFGYFSSEADICNEIWGQTGLSNGVRHPLAYIMEASDDIAYSVLDVEDSIKKKLISYRDLIGFLEHYDSGKDQVINTVLCKSKKEHDKYKKIEELSPSELNDISMQMFRVFAIGELVKAVTETYEKNFDQILSGEFKKDLMGVSAGAKLCDGLQLFARQNAYNHRSVLELELIGFRVIHSIMDMLWPAIKARGCPIKDEKHNGNPFEKYAYSIISENYKRIFEDKHNEQPLQYKRAQLLADMISGMTDNFALDFEQSLTRFKLQA